MDNKILTLQYPSDINSNNDEFANKRVIFMAMPGEPDFENQKKFYSSNKFKDLKDIQIDGQEIKAIISLAIPSSLTDSQSHTWSQDSLQNAVGGVMDLFSLSKKFGSEGGASDSVADLFGKFGNVMNSVSKIKDAVAYGVGTRKIMMKPGYFQNYQNSDLRTFGFSFDFVPESKKEAEEIQKIIGAFKILSSPSSFYGGSESENAEQQGLLSQFKEYAEQAMSIGTMYSPFVWQIIVTNEAVNKMLQLKTCVCTNVTVTYGTDKFDCFEDGMPKVISMKIDFKEVQLQYAENYAQALNILTNDFNMNPVDVRGGINSTISGGKELYKFMSGESDVSSEQLGDAVFQSKNSTILGQTGISFVTGAKEYGENIASKGFLSATGTQISKAWDAFTGLF